MARPTRPAARLREAGTTLPVDGPLVVRVADNEDSAEDSDAERSREGADPHGAHRDGALDDAGDQADLRQDPLAAGSHELGARDDRQPEQHEGRDRGWDQTRGHVGLGYHSAERIPPPGNDRGGPHRPDPRPQAGRDGSIPRQRSAAVRDRLCERSLHPP
jgi:hypothetical protein